MLRLVHQRWDPFWLHGRVGARTAAAVCWLAVDARPRRAPSAAHLAGSLPDARVSPLPGGDRPRATGRAGALLSGTQLARPLQPAEPRRCCARFTRRRRPTPRSPCSERRRVSFDRSRRWRGCAASSAPRLARRACSCSVAWALLLSSKPLAWKPPCTTHPRRSRRYALQRATFVRSPMNLTRSVVPCCDFP